MAVRARSVFDVIMIKPSRYCEDGYPITWVRSLIPANTLAVLFGLGADAKRRAVLGDDVDIVLKPYDEMSRRVGLDYFIVDCAENQNGELLVFEADNTAVVHNMDSPVVFPYKPPQMRKIFAAFTAMLSRHAKAGVGSAA